MIRIGMVGAGEIAHTHARNLVRFPDVRLVGAFDARPDRSEAFAHEHQATAFADLDGLFGSVDAVYIGTPPKFHREAAVKAASAGVHVFCEKPLADTMEDAEAIAQAVEWSGITFQVGFNFRSSADFMRLKDVVADGMVGDVRQFWGTRLLWLPHSAPNWRTDPRFLCGMTIESLSHDFDFMRWVVGDPVTISGMAATSRPDLQGYDDIMSATMTLERGGIATFHSSWVSHIAFLQHGVIGTQGTILCENGSVQYRKEGQETVQTIDIPASERQISSHQRETDRFIDSLRTGAPPLATVWDGLETVRISTAVLQSSREKVVVSVERHFGQGVE